MLLSIPQMAPRWLYMTMLFLLQLTQLSSQLSTKISTIKNFQINYIYTGGFQKKRAPMKIVIVSIIIKLWRDGSPKVVAIYSILKIVAAMVLV